MENGQRNDNASPEAAGEDVGLSVFQFVGLLRVAEFNAHAAARAEAAMRTAHGINAVLVAFAALEALVLETAYVNKRELYDEMDEKNERAKFRNEGVTARFARYRKAVDQSTDIPSIITEVSRLRKSLTHSEPDNDRSASVGATIDDGEKLIRIVAEVRAAAEWLWGKGRPKGVSQDFDLQNPLLS